MRIALVVASLALVAGGAVGCGGGGDAKGSDSPKDASKSDFCNGFKDLSDDTSGDSDSVSKAEIQKAKATAKKLADTGTPKGIPADARKGFEVYVDLFEKIKDDASSKDLDALGDKVSATDQKDVEAFITYVTTECADVLGSTG